MNQGEPTWTQSTIDWLEPLSTKSSQRASGIMWYRKAYLFEIIWTWASISWDYHLHFAWQVCFYFFCLHVTTQKWPNRTRCSLLWTDPGRRKKILKNCLLFPQSFSSQGSLFLFCFVFFSFSVSFYSDMSNIILYLTKENWTADKSFKCASIIIPEFSLIISSLDSHVILRKNLSDSGILTWQVEVVPQSCPWILNPISSKDTSEFWFHRLSGTLITLSLWNQLRAGGQQPQSLSQHMCLKKLLPLCRLSCLLCSQGCSPIHGK